ncbi:MAG: porin, partial [Alphaproteobacteria bacterium]|nr:porin [Alphaproteobacteria bacterium]
MNAKKIVRLFTVISLSFLPTSVSGANGMDIKPAYVSDSTETKLPRVCKKEGFFSLPGMDSLCWKVGGVLSYIGVLEGPEFIRPGAGAAVGFGPNDLFPPSEGEGAGYLFSGRVLGRVNFDARSRFSYGSFRTFVEIEARADIKAGSPRSLDLRHAYVRLGDILFGKTTTTWAHLDSMPDYGSGVSLISDPG